MATENVATPATAALHPPAEAPVNKPHIRLIPVTLWAATGAASTLWINGRLAGPNAEQAFVWLFVIAVLAAWPSYLIWRSTRRIKAALADLQEQVQQTSSYRDGYADGYLACAAMTLRADGKPPAQTAK